MKYAIILAILLTLGTGLYATQALRPDTIMTITPYTYTKVDTVKANDTTIIVKTYKDTSILVKSDTIKGKKPTIKPATKKIK